MNRLCTLCARGGSKGVPDKNLRLLNGVPLLAHSLRQARESGLFAALAVSSDSPQILDAAREYGADILVRRPDEMATDAAPKVPAIQHCVRQSEAEFGRTFDVTVDLSATSPLRIADDIRGAVALLESDAQISNVITGSPARCSPYFSLVEIDENGAVHISKKPEKPIVRRQDAPPCFDMNGSIYVWRRNFLLENIALFHPGTRLYEMPDERSHDIDTEHDFQFVQWLMERKKSTP